MNALEDVMQELSGLGALMDIGGPSPLEAAPEPLPVAAPVKLKETAPSTPRVQALDEQLAQWEATISALAEALTKGLDQIVRAQEMIAKARILEQGIRSIK